MIPVNVSSNINEISARFTALTDRVQSSAIVSALNRTATTVRAEASREIRKVYKISSSAAKDQMKLIKASRGNLEVRIRAQGKRAPLLEFASGSVMLNGIRFQARGGKLRVAGSQRRRGGGVAVQIKVAGGRKVIRGAFIAAMPSGHIGVFARGKYGGGSFVPGRRRLPISELTTLSLPRAFANDRVMQVLKRIATATFVKNFQHEISYRTSGT